MDSSFVTFFGNKIEWIDDLSIIFNNNYGLIIVYNEFSLIFINYSFSLF